MYPDVKPCPFCGRHMNPNDHDTLYPSGIGWKEEEDGHRHYVDIYDGASDAPWCYKMVCQEHYGGCGVEMHGDSIEETIHKWNRRV